MTFPYARTFDEVLAYVKKRRCVCGAARTEVENRAGEKVVLGGVSAVRFDFSCVKCARLREFTFRLPEETPIPTLGSRASAVNARPSCWTPASGCGWPTPSPPAHPRNRPGWMLRSGSGPTTTSSPLPRRPRRPASSWRTARTRCHPRRSGARLAEQSTRRTRTASAGSGWSFSRTSSATSPSHSETGRCSRRRAGGRGRASRSIGISVPSRMLAAVSRSRRGLRPLRRRGHRLGATQ